MASSRIKWDAPHRMGLRRLGLLSLEEYYASLVWRDIRDAWTGEWACYVCGGTSELVLHHLSYMRLGEEKDTDLVALCRTHHDEVHKAVRQRPRICRGLAEGHEYVARRYREAA